MEIVNTSIGFFYGFIAMVLLAGSFWIKPGIKGWWYYITLIAGFVIGGLMIDAYFLAGSAIVAIFVSVFRRRQYIEKNRMIEVVLVYDRDDYYLNHFLDYYRTDISRYFPRFDFKIEDEFLVALLFSKMESIGLIVAEIKDKETLRICIDYMVPKYRNSQLARTFYQCELRCIDFLGYRNLYIEPQSREHNNYLERVGFKLVDGKYVIRFLDK